MVPHIVIARFRRHDQGDPIVKLDTIAYKRSRFSTRLPAEYRYTASHYWLREGEPASGRSDSQSSPRECSAKWWSLISEYSRREIDVGQMIGWTEGFKAMSDIYSAVAGEFLGPNPALARAITLIDNEPYGEGWLYQARGTPDPAIPM